MKKMEGRTKDWGKESRKKDQQIKGWTQIRRHIRKYKNKEDNQPDLESTKINFQTSQDSIGTLSVA